MRPTRRGRTSGPTASTTRRRRRRRSRSRRAGPASSRSPGRRSTRGTPRRRPSSIGASLPGDGRPDQHRFRSNAPPANFPVLCAAATGCRNSLSSTYYNVIWGNRSAVARRAAAEAGRAGRAPAAARAMSQHVRLPGTRHGDRARVPGGCSQPGSARKSPRPARSAIRTGAASAPSGGSTASAR